MRRYNHSFPAFTVTLALAVLTLLGTAPNSLYAQKPGMGMGGPVSKVEITIRDRQRGYETEGMAMPSQNTIIVVRNEDSVTHGFASTLFQGIWVRVENGIERKGKNFRSFHVNPGETMVLRFTTAPKKFDAAGALESLRHALWCDIHPEVRGEVYVIETWGEIGGG